jgi:hypothetical protein
MLEYWITGMMSIGLRPPGLKARRGFCIDGLIKKFVWMTKFKMDIFL